MARKSSPPAAHRGRSSAGHGGLPRSAGRSAHGLDSVTDNPGGGPMLPPDWLAGKFAGRSAKMVVHLTCKDAQSQRAGSGCLAFCLGRVP